MGRKVVVPLVPEVEGIGNEVEVEVGEGVVKERSVSEQEEGLRT